MGLRKVTQIMKSTSLRTYVVQLDDGRVLEFDSENSQFILADRNISKETAIRYFVDYAQEPFNKLFKSKVDEICALYQNDKVP